MRNLRTRAIFLAISTAAFALSGCATLPPSATESRASDFPVPVQSSVSQPGVVVKITDSRPLEQKSFIEKPTATGRYAVLGDGAITPEPIQLVSDAIANAAAVGAGNIQAELLTFRIEVVFRTPERGCSPSVSVTPIPSAGGRLLFIPSGYFACGTWQDTMSSIDVKIHALVDGKDHIAQISVPFERRLEPVDVANTVTQAIDRLKRSMKS